MNFFNIGLPEMVLILTLALLVFGPKKLPEIGRSLGKAIRGFQQASKEFETEFKKEAERLEQTVNQPMKATLEPSEPKALSPTAADPTSDVETQTAEVPAESGDRSQQG